MLRTAVGLVSLSLYRSESPLHASWLAASEEPPCLRRVDLSHSRLIAGNSAGNRRSRPRAASAASPVNLPTAAIQASLPRVSALPSLWWPSRRTTCFTQLPRRYRQRETTFREHCQCLQGGVQERGVCVRVLRVKVRTRRLRSTKRPSSRAKSARADPRCDPSDSHGTPGTVVPPQKDRAGFDGPIASS
jgi:hypothetical protein